MNDRFDDFLKRNAPVVPGPPLGEKQTIQRKIQNRSAVSRLKWWTIFVPATCAVVAALFFKPPSRSARDAEVDQLLMSAISYELEEDDISF
jgi:hypothetical protein